MNGSISKDVSSGSSSSLSITHKVTKLSDRKRRHKASSDKVVLEQIGDPLGVLLVRLFAANERLLCKMYRDSQQGLIAQQ